jgi:large subunit ribosomal protein L15
MKLNNLVKTNTKKIRPGRGIGSGKGKTGGRGVKGQKSRSGVAIKAFEGGQTPLYRRLPKRGFKSLAPDNTAIINLSYLQKFHDNKKIDLNIPIDLKLLQEKKIINKKYIKLKILGDGELKNKTSITANFASKQALAKIEKAGGTINILKKFIKKQSQSKSKKIDTSIEVTKK